MLIESLESRQLMSASLAPNPGDPQAANSGNLVAVYSSQVTGNGGVVSAQAQAGTRAAGVQAVLAASGLGKNG